MAKSLTTVARGARRIVVKIGSSLLATQMHYSKLADDIVAVRELDKEVVVVSSGAIAEGMRALKMEKRPPGIATSQALAAIGQSALMDQWIRAFAPIPAAQFLLSRDDVEDPRRFINARRALVSLLQHSAIPIGNENDAVYTDAIRIGNNDALGAFVAKCVNADLLVILTEVAGLFTANPEKDRNATLIPFVAPSELDRAAAVAGDASSGGLGVGGFATKVDAARYASRVGVPVIIASATVPGILRRMFGGEACDGTLFAANDAAANNGYLREVYPVRGGVDISGECADTLWPLAGKPTWVQRDVPMACVSGVTGAFDRGDVVNLRCARSGAVVGRALAGYSSAVVAAHKGKSDDELLAALGRKEWDGAAIHAGDYLVFAS